MTSSGESITKDLQLIKAKDLNPLREKLFKEQGGVCPLLKVYLPIDQFVIDHQHRQNRQQTVGENGAGLVRGCIQRQANIIEGKISNAWKRYALGKHGTSLPDFLRNLADYLEQENLPLVHPSEQERPKIVQKSCYNKLAKVCITKMPVYRVSPKGKNMQKLTKALETLFKKYNIEVQYY